MGPKEIKAAIIEEVELGNCRQIIIGIDVVGDVVQIFTTHKLRLIELISNISDNFKASYSCGSVVSVWCEK